MHENRVLLEVESGVAVATLNHPEKANAFDGEMWLALEEAAAAIRLNDEVRAVVITGAGSAFCGGLDLKLAASEGISLGSRTLRDGYESLSYLSGVFTLFEKLPVPVIAAINGGCIGLGMELALACDIRLAADDAVFSIPEVVFGLVPDCGGTQRLPRLIGPAMAGELIYTGRKFDAAEALRIGLVNHIYARANVLGEAKTMAAEIAAHRAGAVQASKRCLKMAMNSTLDSGLNYETASAETVLGEKAATMIRHDHKK